MKDVVIVGGGASGVCAAIEIKKINKFAWKRTLQAK